MMPCIDSWVWSYVNLLRAIVKLRSVEIGKSLQASVRDAESNGEALQIVPIFFLQITPLQVGGTRKHLRVV
jgi:hypothetical protein